MGQKTPKEEFKLEHQYQLYLKRVKLTEDKMHPQQKKQLREVFMGACGQMLLLLRDDVAQYSDDEAIDIMKDMLNDVGEFFLNKKGQQN